MHPATTRGRAVPSSHRRLRAAAILVLLAALTGAVLAVPIAAATSSVTGSITYRERIALTPQAVAIITIVDTTAAPDAGVVIGQQRIDAPTAVPIDFSVLVDASTIDQTHAYALFATIVDGTSTWQNPIGEPVITGGPTSGLALTLASVPATPAATITGTIVPPAATAIGPAAVSIAALIKVETGTLVARQVRPISDPANLGFSIGYDPSLLDPAATYVVKGGIVDGSSAWQNREGVSAISGGKASGTVTLPVTLASTPVPVASGNPSAAPSASAVPTALPTAPPPSGEPTAAASPSATAAPTATPAPTADPRPDRDARPDPDPDADLHAVPDADAGPDANADRRRHPDRDADRGAEPKRRAVQRGLSDADHGPGHGDADLSRAAHPQRGRLRGRRTRARLGPRHREFDRRVGDRPWHHHHPRLVLARPRRRDDRPIGDLHDPGVDRRRRERMGHRGRDPGPDQGQPEQRGDHAQLSARSAQGRGHRPDHGRRRRAVGHGLFDGRARRSRHRQLAGYRCQGRDSRPAGRVLGPVRDHGHRPDE